MSLLIKNALLYLPEGLKRNDVLLKDGHVFFASSIEDNTAQIINKPNILITPGLIDTHVHLRTPGYEYKETITSGTKAALKGGVLQVLAMPNTSPCMDSLEKLETQRFHLQRDALCNVQQISALSYDLKGEKLVDIEQISSSTKIFSDDGKGLQNSDLMLEAMQRVKKIDGIITAHCEDEKELKPHGSVHDGKLCAKYNLVGINSASEWRQVARDLEFSKQTGCRYHICHISTLGSVELLRKAKKTCSHVSAEVTPHHLLLCEDDITENHGRFKMNPPLRTKFDQQALIKGIQDNTIEIIATDHAPHSNQEKNCTLDQAAMGITGIEISFALIYTELVLKKIISLEKQLDLMYKNPLRIFQLPDTNIYNGHKANLSIFDLDENYQISEDKLVSQGKSTPFLGKEVFGKCLYTYINGEKNA